MAAPLGEVDPVVVCLGSETVRTGLALPLRRLLPRRTTRGGAGAGGADFGTTAVADVNDDDDDVDVARLCEVRFRGFDPYREHAETLRNLVNTQSIGFVEYERRFAAFCDVREGQLRSASANAFDMPFGSWPPPVGMLSVPSLVSRSGGRCALPSPDVLQQTDFASSLDLVSPIRGGQVVDSEGAVSLIRGCVAASVEGARDMRGAAAAAAAALGRGPRGAAAAVGSGAGQGGAAAAMAARRQRGLDPDDNQFGVAADTPVLVSAPRGAIALAPLAENIFEEYGAPAVRFETAAVLALRGALAMTQRSAEAEGAAASTATAVVVQSGAEVTRVVAVVQGRIVAEWDPPAGAGVQPTWGSAGGAGGSGVTDHLVAQLRLREGQRQRRAHRFDPDDDVLRPGTRARREVHRHLKERLAVVSCAQDGAAAVAREETYTLPDGAKVRAGAERELCTDWIFGERPEPADDNAATAAAGASAASGAYASTVARDADLARALLRSGGGGGGAGAGDDGGGGRGTAAEELAPVVAVPLNLSRAVFDLIESCNSDFREALASNVVLAGGNTLIPGFDTRLQEDLVALGLPHAKVLAPAARASAEYVGGSLLASLWHADSEAWVSRAQYLETGNSVFTRSEQPRVKSANFGRRPPD